MLMASTCSCRLWVQHFEQCAVSVLQDCGCACRSRITSNQQCVVGSKHQSVLAGDPRVDEHAVLTSMHTIWIREHNRLCKTMQSGRFRYLNDDQKFDKARKVLSC
jgi:Animal haem peroxidase